MEKCVECGKPATVVLEVRLPSAPGLLTFDMCTECYQSRVADFEAKQKTYQSLLDAGLTEEQANREMLELLEQKQRA